MLLGWSQQDLVARSHVSLRSLTRFENGQESSGKTKDALYRAFVIADIQFIAANTTSTEIDGVGLRWKPRLPHDGIKIV